MEHGVVVNPIFIVPDQVSLTLVAMEYRAVIMPTRLRAVARLDDPFLIIIRGSERQPLERDVKRTLYRDGLTITDEPYKASGTGLTDPGSTSPVSTSKRRRLFAVSASLDVVDILGLSSDKTLSIAELVC